MEIRNDNSIFRAFGGGKCEIDFHVASHSATISGETSNFNPKTGIGAWTNLDRTHEGFNNSLISCTVEKKMSEPFGTFVINMINAQNSDGRTWLDILRPRQLVVIKMAGSGSENYSIKTKPVMIGFIDQINKLGRYNSDSPNVNITIQGSDIGKALSDARIYYYYFHDQGSQIYKNLADVVPYGKQNKVLKDIIEKIFYDAYNMNFYFSGNPEPRRSRLTNMRGLVGYKLGFSDGNLLSYNNMILPQAPIWNVMKNFVNQPFNELFVDVISDDEIDSYVGSGNSLTKDPDSHISIDGHRVYVVFRPTPFISRMYGDGSSTSTVSGSLVNPSPSDRDGSVAIWHSLPTVEIEDKDIIEENIGFSSHEVYNYFAVGADYLETALNRNGSPLSTGATNSLIANDVYNLQSIRKFGLKQLLVDLKVVPGSVNPDRDRNDINRLNNSKFLTQYGKLLHDWFIYNHEYRNGTLTVQGNPEIQIGKLIKFEEKIEKRIARWNYYVQGVKHEFIRDNKGGHLYTTADVVRGLDENEPLIYLKTREKVNDKTSELTAEELKIHIVQSVKEQVDLNLELTQKAIEEAINEEGKLTSENYRRGIIKKHSKQGFTALNAKSGLEVVDKLDRILRKTRGK